MHSTLEFDEICFVLAKYHFTHELPHNHYRTSFIIHRTVSNVNNSTLSRSESLLLGVTQCIELCHLDP